MKSVFSSYNVTLKSCKDPRKAPLPVEHRILFANSFEVHHARSIHQINPARANLERHIYYFSGF